MLAESDSRLTRKSGIFRLDIYKKEDIYIMAIVFLGLQSVNTEALSTCFQHNRKETVAVSTTEQFHHLLSRRSQDIEGVITDDQNLIVLKGIIMQYPLLNFGIISPRSTDAFHEATEGYGILMQLSFPPTKEDGMTFLAKLESLAALTRTLAKGEAK
jgi:hypothetical protein